MSWFYIVLILLLQHSFSAQATSTLEISGIEVGKEGPYWVSAWTEFSLPENTASFQINAFGSPETFLQVTDLIDPKGRIYTQSDSGKTLSAYSQPILRNVLSPQRTLAVIKGMSSTLVPNNPRWGSPAAGVWKFRTLSHYQPLAKKIHVEIVIKTQEELQKNKLKIAIWYAPTGYWSRHPEQIPQIFEAARASLEEAGLALEKVAVASLKESIMEPMVLPTDMVAVAGIYNRADVLNVYLMPSMQYQNKPVNGLACIGGPINLKNKHACFVSMYADDRADLISIASKGKILAHEIGHYLGLFHTRDDGYHGIRHVYDSLEDTSEQVLGTNMMDPGIHDETPHFSWEQKKMVRLSPILN